MSNLVIVAVPDENDRVWKVSSEQVPHLTLLFLGDMGAVSNLEQIMLFVEHAANTTLKRFYLPVDRRGELGNDPDTGPADVLFFKKGRYDFKAVRDFRSTLLQDHNIKTAYDSAQQFDGPWQPHLTLGYPETTPANAIPDDQIGTFYDVCFNKIAVWTGDFEGPEFLLKDYWDEFDVLDYPMDVAMSDLEHHGVKGMRWGVRTVDVASGAKAVGRAAKSTGGTVGKAAGATSRFVRDVNFEAKVENGKAREAVIGGASKSFHKEDLPAVKARHGDYAKLRNRAKKPFSKEAKAYRQDARETYVKRLESTANSMKNASGTRQYTIRERGIEQPAQGGRLPQSKHFWDVSSREVTHAFADDFTRLELVMDEEGYISDLKQVEIETTMAQTADLGAAFLAHQGIKISASDLGSQFVLEHFGVKGMRWGQRKMPPSAVTPTATSKVPHGAKRKTKIQTEGGENHPAHEDAIKVAEARAKLGKSGSSALSNKELRDVANRLQLEQQVAQLTSSKGRKFVRRQLEQEGQQQFQKGLRKGTKTAGKTAFKLALA